MHLTKVTHMLTLTTGEKILILRKRAGFTQQQLAHIVDAPRLIINGIENGYRRPGVDLTERIAVALRVPVTVIVNERSGDEE